MKDSKEGTQKVKIKFDPTKDLPFHHNLEVAGVKAKGVPGGVADVHVRTHSTNPKFAQTEPTTQINTDDGYYRIPDPNAAPGQPDPGIFKEFSGMTDSERAAAHSPAAHPRRTPAQEGPAAETSSSEAGAPRSPAAEEPTLADTQPMDA